MRYERLPLRNCLEIGLRRTFCLDPKLTNDLKLLHRWANDYPKHTRFIKKGSLGVQFENLKARMSSKSSLPAIACWDSTPVGYLEVFWALEDPLGRSLNGVWDWDRGLRFFISDDDFNDSKILAFFLISFVHYCWLSDRRTYAIFVETRGSSPLRVTKC